jgi:3-hydroxyacyl-CoA dehydrogenase
MIDNPNIGSHGPVRADTERISLDALREAGKEVSRNDSASLLDLGNGVLCFELHSQANAIDSGVVEVGRQALRELENGTWVGMVIGNEAKNFCSGANLSDIVPATQQGQWDQLRERVKAFQDLAMGLRFSNKPVVAAPHGLTLGAGAEIAMHCSRVVAAAETRMGLVEMGVGLLPAGGGTKEIARRLISRPMTITPTAPPLPFVQKAFETIAQAKVSGNALEARTLGFLTEEDIIITNSDSLLATAKHEVLDLAENYSPPKGGMDMYAAGRPVLAALETGILQLVWGGFVTEYDGVVARMIATVLCGGELSAGQWVSEDYMLTLEQEGFLSLLHNQKTMERIEAMLKTGKPFRN